MNAIRWNIPDPRPSHAGERHVEPHPRPKDITEFRGLMRQACPVFADALAGKFDKRPKK